MQGPGLAVMTFLMNTIWQLPTTVSSQGEVVLALADADQTVNEGQDPIRPIEGYSRGCCSQPANSSSAVQTRVA